MLLSTLLYGILLGSQSLAMQQILSPYTESGPQDIPSEILNYLTLFSEYSAAATCAENFNSLGGTKVVCEAGVCPMLEQTNAIVELGFMEHNPGNTTGFVAIDHTNQVIVLAFRGSRTPGNVKTDSEYKQEEVYGICPGCQAHSGFYSAWLGFSGFILPYIEYYASIYPYDVVFTGHSLGGALATLGAALNGVRQPIYLYTYGCPELGNYYFAQYITAATQYRTSRVTHANDPVPKILSTSPIVNRTWQYSTTSPEYWINTTNDVVTTNDIHLIWGINNTSGNLGTKGENISAHNWYIGNMSGCPTN